MDRLVVRTQSTPDYILLTLTGPAGLADADALEDAVEKLVEKRPTKVIVDLTGLKFVCSIAIGHLLALGRAIKANNGVCVLAGANHDVGAALDRCRVGHLMPIATSVDDGVAKLAK